MEEPQLNVPVPRIFALILASLMLAGCASGNSFSEPPPSPEEAEAAFFEFADDLFPSGDTPGLISAADGICRALEEGNSRVAVERTISEGGGSEVSDSQAEDFLALSISYRCPELAE
jgi:hypothetical protein